MEIDKEFPFELLWESRCFDSRFHIRHRRAEAGAVAPGQDGNEIWRRWWPVNNLFCVNFNSITSSSSSIVVSGRGGWHGMSGMSWRRLGVNWDE